MEEKEFDREVGDTNFLDIAEGAQKEILKDFEQDEESNSESTEE